MRGFFYKYYVYRTHFFVLTLYTNYVWYYMSQKVLLHAKEVKIILNRLACQLIENHNDFSNTVLIGIQPRGAFVAKRIADILTSSHGITNLDIGYLDITFYRDDFRRGEKPLKANTTEINFVIDGKNVVFIDDVLYSGRSVRAALTAIQSFGRPSSIELLTLIDRRFSRHLPIQPNYKGRQVDAINNERVVVNWSDETGSDSDMVYITNKEN